MATTAIGAIPGGLMMFALTAQILKERGQYQDLMTLAYHSMDLFKANWDGKDLPLDRDYQIVLPEFHARKAAMTPADLPDAFRLVYGMTPGT
jgi:enoyl-[acyl-carrier protein] reductase/trans-2-enoyl-CoA reductase (NAD+)